MSGLPYEKIKGMTPSTKGVNKKFDEETGLKNSRNNHTRMPSLPNAMQGGIGTTGFGGS